MSVGGKSTLLKLNVAVHVVKKYYYYIIRCSEMSSHKVLKGTFLIKSCIKLLIQVVSSKLYVRLVKVMLPIKLNTFLLRECVVNIVYL